MPMKRQTTGFNPPARHASPQIAVPDDSPEMDLVYLYANGNDKEWLEKRKQYAQDKGNGACRYRDNNDLLFSLRSVEKYAPWIRRIYIVTDCSLPEWLNTQHEKIRIVDHREIMPAELLPCYNSNVIESFLTRIPDLSEVFLYANDDMFFGRDVSPGFFVRNGKPVVRMMKTRDDLQIKKNYYQMALWNANRLIADRFGIRYPYIPWHNVDVYLKSGIQQCLEDFQEEFLSASQNRLRSEHDIQRVIFHYWLISHDACILKTYDMSGTIRRSVYYLKVMLSPSRYFDYVVWKLHDVFRIPLLKYLLQKRPRCVCLNDTEDSTAEDLVQYRELLRKMFPQQSAFEKSVY